MKLKMAPNSLFAILLRSPWWIALVIAAVICLASMAVLPPHYAVFGAMGCLPFVVIAGMAGWKQWHAPSARQTERRLEAAAAMTWNQFSAAVEAGFQHEGYVVQRGTGAADFSLLKDGRTTLVGGKRWKAARHGIEPLRELDAACQTQDAHDSIYLALGELSANAQAFAKRQQMRVLQGAALAQLLRSV